MAGSKRGGAPAPWPLLAGVPAQPRPPPLAVRPCSLRPCSTTQPTGVPFSEERHWLGLPPGPSHPSQSTLSPPPTSKRLSACASSSSVTPRHHPVLSPSPGLRQWPPASMATLPWSSRNLTLVCPRSRWLLLNSASAAALRTLQWLPVTRGVTSRHFYLLSQTLHHVPHLAFLDKNSVPRPWTLAIPGGGTGPLPSFAHSASGRNPS